MTNLVYCMGCNGSGLVKVDGLRYICGWCNGYGEATQAAMDKWKEQQQAIPTWPALPPCATEDFRYPESAYPAGGIR